LRVGEWHTCVECYPLLHLLCQHDGRCVVCTCCPCAVEA
jgi:hypothetical protein